MVLAKIDMYEYMVLPGVIQISLDGTNDPIMVDILSEIDKSNGKIYADGDFYLFLGYDIYTEDTKSFMDLKVVQTN